MSKEWMKIAGRRVAPWIHRAKGFLLAFIAPPLLFAACGSASTASSTTKSISIPSGWKTYAYGKAVLAVPNSWAIKHDDNCPNAAAPGTLRLGLSRQVTTCPGSDWPASVVTVSKLTSNVMKSDTPSGGEFKTVNSIPVYAMTAPPATTLWIVPSLGVQISGNGPNSRRVMDSLKKS